MDGLRDQLSARPARAASYPVSVRQVAALLHASFRPRLAATPLRFANTSPPSGCVGDLHPQAVEHARHTTNRFAEIPESDRFLQIRMLHLPTLPSGTRSATDVRSPMPIPPGRRSPASSGLGMTSPVLGAEIGPPLRPDPTTGLPKITSARCPWIPRSQGRFPPAQ